MAAASTDKLMEVGLATATTLDANYTISDTTVTVASTSNWPTSTGIIFAIDVVDSNGEQVPGSYNEYAGVVSTSTSITSVSHQNGTDRNYSAGATTRVYIPVSAERENRIVEWGIVEHNQDGTHSAVTATTVTTTGDVTVGDDIKVADTKAIRDGNDNELIKFSQTASAVNELTVKNAATGNQVQLQATGGDTNIGLQGVPKGTGINTGFIAAKVVTFTPSSTGSLAVTGVGFRPKAIIAIRSVGSATTSVQVMMSVTDGTTSRAQSATGGGGGANLNTETSTNFIHNEGSTGSVTCSASLTSFDADGFTLNVGTAESVLYTALCFG